MSLNITLHDVSIDWITPSDLPDVLWIDGQCFRDPHSGETLTAWLHAGRGRRIGIVLRVGQVMQGFALYEMHKHSLHLHRLAVTPTARQQGVATLLLLRLQSKVQSGKRRCITAQVDERNVPMQKLLRCLCFRCTGSSPDPLPDLEGDLMLNFRYVSLTPNPVAGC